MADDLACLHLGLVTLAQCILFISPEEQEEELNQGAVQWFIIQDEVS
jgi:hypothetical protein